MYASTFVDEVSSLVINSIDRVNKDRSTPSDFKI